MSGPARDNGRGFRWVFNFFYTIFCIIFFPYLLFKYLTTPKFKIGLGQKLGRIQPRTSDKPCIWIHGVSVGEMQVARPLVEALRTRYPDADIVLSTTTNTGEDLAKGAFPDLQVFYWPLDFTPIVRHSLDVIRPTAVILVELEIWPNFLSYTQERKIPVIVVNGRMSERSFKRYKQIPVNFRRVLRWIDFYCAQNEAYAERFRTLGIPDDRIRVTGNMKFDGVETTEDTASIEKNVRKALGFTAKDPVLIGGSIHPPEERYLIDCWKRLRDDHPKLRLVLVPRHEEKISTVQATFKEAGCSFILKTELDKGTKRPDDAAVLVDTVGDLKDIYTMGTVVFVGGSLIPHGGQNMVEPAGLGKAVLFGPHTKNFKIAVELLLSFEGAIQLKSEKELETEIRRLLDDPKLRKKIGTSAKKAVASQRGATDRNLETIQTILASTSLGELAISG